MHLIVGLGNPGALYEKTRHNAGFLALDTLQKLLPEASPWKQDAGQEAWISLATIEGHRVALIKPTTFMNLSGRAVQKISAFYRVNPQEILCISDDTTLQTGTLRIRAQGSSGGHNGLKSLIASLGTETFWRIRVGVGSPPSHIPLETWVLQRLPSEDLDLLRDRSELLITYLTHFVCGKLTEQTLPMPPSSPLA